MSGMDNFGRDDGITCDTCKGPTYLVYDQGYGLKHYRCDNCDEEFGVQFDYDDEAERDEDPWDEVYWEGF